MSKIIDFKKGSKNNIPIDTVDDSSENAYKDGALFFDDDLNPAYVFDVIGDEKIRLAFVTMLLALRQIATDGDVVISIDAEGVRFDSSNSADTSDFTAGFQSNTNLMKQGYLFMVDSMGRDIPANELADSLGLMLSSLIVYKEEDSEDGDEPAE